MLGLSFTFNLKYFSKNTLSFTDNGQQQCCFSIKNSAAFSYSHVNEAHLQVHVHSNLSRSGWNVAREERLLGKGQRVGRGRGRRQRGSWSPAELRKTSVSQRRTYSNGGGLWRTSPDQHPQSANHCCPPELPSVSNYRPQKAAVSAGFCGFLSLNKPIIFFGNKARVTL